VVTDIEVMGKVLLICGIRHASRVAALDGNPARRGVKPPDIVPSRAAEPPFGTL
jgi:hypothetical protein